MVDSRRLGTASAKPSDTLTLTLVSPSHSLNFEKFFDASAFVVCVDFKPVDQSAIVSCSLRFNLTM